MKDPYKDRLDAVRRATASSLDTGKSSKSGFWEKNWRFFKYMLSLNDDDLRMIRFHASLLSEDHPLKYWVLDRSHGADRIPMIQAYQRYTDGLGEAYRIGEPRIEAAPEQHGVLFEGRIVNDDILRYQAVISNLATLGVFDHLAARNKRLAMLEVGGGYGGLAFQIAKIVRNVSYVLIDNPEALFLAGAYLALNHPTARIYLFDEATCTKAHFRDSFEEYDYLLVPDFALSELKAVDFDLFLNLMSFQEMSEKQIDAYLSFAADRCRGFLYSENFYKVPTNRELAGTVEEHLARYFRLFPSLGEYEDPRYGDSYKGDWYQQLKVFVGRSKRRDPEYTLNGYLKILGGTFRLSADGVVL
jgi:putative sugar O-methyltransferase